MLYLSINNLTDVESMLTAGFFFAVRQNGRTDAVSSMHTFRRSALSRAKNIDEVVDLKEVQNSLVTRAKRKNHEDF